MTKNLVALLQLDEASCNILSASQVAKNDELTMELLNLINAKSALAQQSRSPKFKDEAAALAREEERIRGVVHRLSHGGMTMVRYSDYSNQFW